MRGSSAVALERSGFAGVGFGNGDKTKSEQVFAWKLHLFNTNFSKLTYLTLFNKFSPPNFSFPNQTPLLDFSPLSRYTIVKTGTKAEFYTIAANLVCTYLLRRRLNMIEYKNIITEVTAYEFRTI